MLRCFRDGISCRLITHSITEKEKKINKSMERSERQREGKKRRKRDQRIKKYSEERETMKKEVQRKSKELVYRKRRDGNFPREKVTVGQKERRRKR